MNIMHFVVLLWKSKSPLFVLLEFDRFESYWLLGVKRARGDREVDECDQTKESCEDKDRSTPNSEVSASHYYFK